MNTKKVLLWVGGTVVLLLLLGIGVGAFLWMRRPQTITLDDGTQLKLVQVSYGKHHNFPSINTTGTSRSRGRSAAFDSTNDTLVVWIEQAHKANQHPSIQSFAYDRAATACVGNSTMTFRQIRPGDEIVGIRFDAFPRRSGKFNLRFMQWGPNGQKMAKDQFVISNPARGSFARWSPESLPATQSDGDLNVTLTRLSYGADGFMVRNRDLGDDPMNESVLAAFRMEQDGSAATNWQAIQVVTSDATGNHITGWCSSHWEGDEEVTRYQWGLWPDEPAWRLRVELTRTSGFTDGEMWTLPNLPVEPGRMQEFYAFGRNRTNSAFAETDLNGVHLKLFPVKRFTDPSPSPGPMEAGLVVQTDAPVAGMRLTLARVADEQGRDLQSWNWGWGGNEFRFRLGNLGDTKTVSVTVALHRSRYVEFTARPQKP